MPSLAVFDFDSNTIRFVDGKPVANDVAIALGYSDPAKTVSTKVDKENRSVTKMVTVDGKRRSVTVLEEAGIYQLIFSSKIPAAKTFQQWVFSQVLPEIRKTGGYNLNEDQRRIETRETLAKESRKALTDQIKKYLEELGIYDSRNSGKFFAAAHNQINVLLTTETAKQMRDRLSKQLGREIKDAELIRDWYPHKRLIQYDTVTRTAAGVMSTARSRGQRMTPSEAIDQGFLLTYGFEDYKPTPVVFGENIKEARARLSGKNQKALI